MNELTTESVKSTKKRRAGARLIDRFIAALKKEAIRE